MEAKGYWCYNGSVHPVGVVVVSFYLKVEHIMAPLNIYTLIMHMLSFTSVYNEQQLADA